MEETTTSTREGMIEKAEEYANALRLLVLCPQAAGLLKETPLELQAADLLEDMASELRAVIQRKPPEKFTDDPLDELDLMPRSFYVLRRAGVDTVGQLLQLSAADIRGMRNAGARTVHDIRTKLSAFGLHLRGDGE